MERIYIALTPTMNNFAVLHQGIEIGGKQVFFHYDPKVSVVDGEVHFNFDYFISNGEDEIDLYKAVKIVPKEMLYVNQRYSKLEQALRINNYVNSAKKKDGQTFSQFKAIKTWYHKQVHGASNLISPKGKVVIKPTDGARGVGQILVDPELVSISQVIKALDKYVKGQITTEELVTYLGENKQGLSYSKGSENHPNEGLEAIRDQGFVIQAFVDQIAQEYRVLTDYTGRPTYCQKRMIHSIVDGFPQATGSESDSVQGLDVVLLEEVLDKQSLQDFTELCQNVIGPMSSLDLFITEDNTWGILEYCNQFGIVGVPHHVALELHGEFINALIDGK